MTDPTERARILAALAEQQAQQRQHHVTELADLYTRITELRAELKTAEQTYRAAYRRATGTGLLTGPQLRTLGLPPIDARRRPKTTGKPTPTTPAQQSQKLQHGYLLGPFRSRFRKQPPTQHAPQGG